jgi:hypothetical protein
MKISLIIIIFIILCALAHILYIKKEDFTNIIMHPKMQPKILHLVLFSHDDGAYDMMYQLTSKFYKSFSNVTTYYYCFDPNINEEYEIKDDILYIKGDEGYIPNILDKTIKAFEFFNEIIDYDYIVRSNISTIINFNLLSYKLLKDKPNYGGGVNEIETLNSDGGVIDTNLIGLNYVSGTNIILSNKIVNRILENKNNINYDIIDDVAIGLLIRDYMPDIELTMYNDYYTFENKKGSIFYRSRTDDRYDDVENMKIIINNIFT